MASIDFLKKKVGELHNEAVEIQKIGIELLDIVEFENKRLKRPDYRTPEGAMQRDAVIRYQRWYSTSFRLVEEFIPEWLQTFVKHYESSGINRWGTNAAVDYLQLNINTEFSSKEAIIADFINDLDRQISVLLCIPDAIEIKELNLRKLISAEVAKTEIEQAEVLFAGGFHRASGSIAGVALELHLKTLCDINSIAYKPKDTIEPLAQALYNAKILDIIELKRIQYLASIRNKCSHPNNIVETEVQTLVEGVKKIV